MGIAILIDRPPTRILWGLRPIYLHSELITRRDSFVEPPAAVLKFCKQRIEFESRNRGASRLQDDSLSPLRKRVIA